MTTCPQLATEDDMPFSPGYPLDLVDNLGLDLKIDLEVASVQGILSSVIAHAGLRAPAKTRRIHRGRLREAGCPTHFAAPGKEVTSMSAETAKREPAKAEDKPAFSLDVSEQELLDEFGVLVEVEYGYGA
jgi:hypothetical protein